LEAKQVCKEMRKVGWQQWRLHRFSRYCVKWVGSSGGKRGLLGTAWSVTKCAKHNRVINGVC